MNNITAMDKEGVTMAYTVRKLLESEQFPKMKLLCGEKGLDREVKVLNRKLYP